MPEDFLTRAFSQSAGGSAPDDEPTGPFLTAGVSEESLDEMSEPPLPMSAYTDKLFRYLMGHKRGPLVRARVREDLKTNALEALIAYHTKESDIERRQALMSLKKSSQTWLQLYGSGARKAVRVEYMTSLIASVDFEMARPQLSTQLDASGWVAKPKTSKMMKAIPKALARADESAGMYTDIEGQPESLDDARCTVGAIEGLMSQPQTQMKFNQLATALQQVDIKDALPLVAELIEQYMGILETFDQLGIGSLMNAYSAFRDYRHAEKRLAVIATVGEESNLHLRAFCVYAHHKIIRRQHSDLFLGLMHFVRGISRMVSLLSGGSSAAVTETLNMSGLIGVAIHEQSRNLKGMYKAALGNMGVARKSHSALLIYLAAREDECLDFFKRYLEVEMIRGRFGKAIRRDIWEEIWRLGDTHIQAAIRESIATVDSTKSQLDVLKVVKSSPNVHVALKTLGAASISLTLQRIISGTLSSRPKYSGTLGTEAIMDTLTELLLNAMKSE